MVVLSIGFLGMAGMLSQVMITKTNRNNYENAITLAKAKINELSKIQYAALGTGVTADEKLRLGGPGAEVISQENLNIYGEPDDGSNEGPFIYFLHHMVCQDNTHPDKVTLYDQDPKDATPCDLVDSNDRPNSLYCDEPDDNRVLIKVSAAYRDKNGNCKEAVFEKFVINLL